MSEAKKDPNKVLEQIAATISHDGVKALETNISADGLVMLPMPEGMARPETGAMQFGDDWPGVFIRGDNAAYYSLALDSLLKGNVDPMTTGILAGLNELLKSSKAT